MGLTFAGYPLEFLDGASLGQTTADGVLEVTLPRGSYLFVLRREGFVPVRYPVSVPSETRRFEVRLLPEEDIPEGFVYIPKGPFSSGGDRDAYLSLDRQDVEVEDFFIGEHEVTIGEYLEFIKYISSRIDEDGWAEPLSDWDSPELKPYLSSELVKNRRIRVIPRYRGRDYIRKVDGEWRAGVNLDFPVLAVSVLASMDYALWLGRKHDGRWRFRLPRDLEWEKAARGVDRRTFVWGDYLLLTFCRSQKSTYPEMGREREYIGLYPFDESVYGVRDLAGSMQEPTSELVEEFRLSVMRGGEWSTVDDRDFRIATRNRQRPENIFGTVGLRLAADLPGQ
ncbi:MAG: SUMF1/EgtB/PvdO family nonheme iron enzyme [Planctomycetota bacterium]|nr:SUMF1/EgtB/PvdO family nonheme iron enzyme [Planctomycetota bacterium]